MWLGCVSSQIQEKEMIALIVYMAYWVVEVFHDDILRKINNIASGLARVHEDNKALKELKELSKYWHRLDWWGHAILAVLTGYLVSTGSEWVVQRWIIVVLYALDIAILRVLVLNIGGNLLADRGLFYLGENKIDRIFARVPILYYISCVIVFAVVTYLIIRL